MSFLFPQPIRQIPAANAPQQPTKTARARNKFSRSEDALLVSLVNELGVRDWETIASRMPGRNSRQCRERYQNYLSPNLSHEPWTPEEDRLLEQKLKEFGSKWVNISKYFKNRTDTMLKNRWLVLSRRLNQSKTNAVETQKVPPAQPIQIKQPEPENPSEHKKAFPSLISLLNFNHLSTSIHNIFHIPPLLANPLDIDQFTKQVSAKPIHAM